MKRVLIIKMWALGDILMATPMLNALRARYPDVEITWIVDTFHAEILAGHPQIDHLIALDTGAWRRLLRKGNLPAWIRRTRALNADMKSRGFDAVINCQPEKWWTYFLCPAPARIALYPSPALPWDSRFYTHAIPKPKRAGLHNTQHFLQATQALGCPDASRRMSVGETPDERDFVRDFRAARGLGAGERLVALAPFSTAENRTFDEEFSAELVDRLAKTLDARVLVIGGPKDAERIAAILRRSKSGKGLGAGNTSLRQYVALLRDSELIVAGDSSPMHLAAALGVPYVALFGPTPVDERAPLEGNGTVLVKPIPCAPCDQSTCSNPSFKACLRLITAADVLRAATALLSTPSQP